MTWPGIKQGAHVRVTETGRDPWFGVVQKLEPAKQQGEWLLDVLRDDGRTWALMLGTPGLDVQVVSR